MKSHACICLFLAFPILPAAAEPPPGHPSSNQAIEMLMPGAPAASGELPFHGWVLEAVPANQFVYLKVVDETSVQQWIAVPLQPVSIGSSIRYGVGKVMTNFYSKRLQHTFSSVIFVRDMRVESTGE